MAEAHVVADELVAGRFRLLEVLARETDRVWWRAEDVRDRRVCLVARTRLPGGAGPDTLRRLRARVVRTSEIMRLLRPGGVPAVIDAVVEEGTLWTAADWIDGTPLTGLLDAEGPFTPARAARIGLEVLEVLRVAHEEGITHGELSPGQLFVREGGGVVVAGFGLAGTTLAPRVAAPSYASPEQARDERIGPAADLWALGAVLYTMAEGRPPFRDRGTPEATLRAVDRLPLRAPVRTGPLTRTVQGLLRKNPRERLTRPVVRAFLTRVVDEDPDAYGPPGAAYCEPVRGQPAGRARPNGTALVAGGVLAALAVTAAALAALHQMSGGSPAPVTAPSRPAAPAAPSAPPGAGIPTSASPTVRRTAPSSSPTPSASSPALPAGFHTYSAPEGFSVALPAGWQRLATSRGAYGSSRVTFGPGGAAPALAVTSGRHLGPDPVAVWQDDVEPGLERLPGYHRVGAVRPTMYEGHRAADMEWLSGTGRSAVHTFGRGFLLGGGRGFSLRFTTPATAWDDADDKRALDTALHTFRASADAGSR